MSSSAPSRSLHDYQLGDSLGKGAFGQVYRALNWATGETVAIKQISLPSQVHLSSIQSEISLLKNLKHPNIVKYKGFVKTRLHLYIILEFCENGSLAQIGKRYGKFPEGLVGVYVSQILEGLVYLHEQGVIHRDIKGANILTNKDGTVKLADFGVASSTTTPDPGGTHDVVGSPYWMAPEIIEQAGATTASDIWSLGCLIIELLSGSPPYSHLDPMPALWRIVQDDCPPIPEGASNVVKDFLRCCFQKDPNLRIGARGLIRHPWMVGVRARASVANGESTNELEPEAGAGELHQNTTTSTQASPARNSQSPSTQRRPRPSKPSTSTRPPSGGNPSEAILAPGGAGGTGRPTSQYNYDQAVLRVQEWNQALNHSSTSLAVPIPGSGSSSSLGPSSSGSEGAGSGSGGQTLRPFQFMGAPSSSASSSSSSSSLSSNSSSSGSDLGSGKSVSSGAGSSDKAKTIKASLPRGPVFSPPPVPPIPKLGTKGSNMGGSIKGASASSANTKGKAKATTSTGTKDKGREKSSVMGTSTSTSKVSTKEKDKLKKPKASSKDAPIPAKSTIGTGKGKGPLLIPLTSLTNPLVNPLNPLSALSLANVSGHVNPLLAGSGALSLGLGLGGLSGLGGLGSLGLGGVEEEETNNEVWDDDFEFGEDGEETRMQLVVGRGVAGTSGTDNPSADAEKAGSSKDKGMVTSAPSSSPASSSSEVRDEKERDRQDDDDEEEGEDNTVTSSSRLRPAPASMRTRAVNDRTIRIPSVSSPTIPLPSPRTLSPLEGYRPLSEAEEENYDDDFDFSSSESAPSPMAAPPYKDLDEGGNGDGDEEMQRRVREFKAKTARAAAQAQSQRSTSSSSTTSRPLLFHPDDIKSALFPSYQDEHKQTVSISKRPSLSHLRGYSASSSSSSSSSPSPSLFQGPSHSKAQRPHLVLSKTNPKQISPGPMTAPLPSHPSDGNEDENWDGDFEYDYDYEDPVSAGVVSAGVNVNPNGSRSAFGSAGIVRSVSAGTGIGNNSQPGMPGMTSQRNSNNGGTSLSRSQGASSSSLRTSSGSALAPTPTSALPERFNKYADDSVEAYEDEYEYDVDDSSSPGSTLARTSGPGSAGRPGTLLKLNSRLSNRSSGGGSGFNVGRDGDGGMSDEEDVFAEFDEPFAEDDLETHLQRDKHARLSARVGSLVDDLTLSLSTNWNASNGGNGSGNVNGDSAELPGKNSIDGGRVNGTGREETREEKLRGVVAELLTILIASPEMQTQLVSSHGMLAILEVLEWYQNQPQSLNQNQLSSSQYQYSPNPSPRMRGDLPLPSSPASLPTTRKSTGMGVVSSLGLGSLVSLGSLALGGSGSPSPLGPGAATSAVTAENGGSIGVSFQNTIGLGISTGGGGLTAGGREIVLQLLRVVNLLVTGNIGFLEGFCLIGGIPVIMGFTSKRYPSECRLEASNFIRLLCHASVLTLQMFISCRGLKTLVGLLDEDPSSPTQAPLVVHALNGIASVFDLQSPTTKNDFCRMFVREGLLEPLSGALLNVMANGNENGARRNKNIDGVEGGNSEDLESEGNNSGDSMDSGTDGESVEEGMKMKIIRIILVFSQVSQSDLHVRNAVGTRKVVRRLLRACEILEPECLVLMLKAVKHLSMNVALLDVLQNANAIEILVRILEEQATSPYSTEVSNHIFQTCFNLCRLNKSRQEAAAQAGIIPCLQRVAETQSPLKQFALPILCDMASAGKSCRELLWQHDGLNMYLKLLEDPYFQVSALESIISWLQDEPSRVEDTLIKTEAIRCIIGCFVTAKANAFENLLELFLKLTRLATRITTAFGRSAQFFRRVADKLAHTNKPVVRLNLLRILKSVCEAHPNRGILVEKYGSGDGLLGVVEGLSRGGGDGAVLVRELAKEIIPVLRPGLKPLPGGGRAGGRVSVTPKRMRRTASEASTATGESTGSAATVGVVAGSALSTSSSTRRGVLSPLAARIGSTRPKARQKLGDIPWQGPGAESK